MSAFLGPIHYWLYNKIKLQNNMVEEIISFAEKNNYKLNLKEELNRQFGSINIRPLEEQIDTTNIHGWLQECVSTVEHSLAYCVTVVLKEDSEAFDKLRELFYNYGAGISQFDANTTVEEIYKQINDTLLDGMPCDHAYSIVSQEDFEILWKRNVCVHESYWTAVGGDIRNYYILRDEFLKGFINKSDATIQKIDDVTYQLKK